jgi:perosamine synthetase
MVVSPFRRQLPVRSPLTARCVAAACVEAVRPGQDPGDRLRHTLAARFGAERVLLFDSGTHALTAALRAATDEAGGERVVALPGYTCYDVATAAVGADYAIHLYDIDPDTLAPDWATVENALRAGARVLVLGPLYGYPFDWAPARDLALRHGALLVEDAAQGAGGEWHGAPMGSFGGMSVVSFGRGKGWTGGNGGALLGRNRLPPAAEEPEPAGGLGPLATSVALLALGRPALYGLPHAVPWLHLGETRYREPTPARGMSRFAAALAVASRPHADMEVEARRVTAARLEDALGAVPGLGLVQHSPPAAPGFLRLAGRFAGPRLPTRAVHALGRLGIERGYPATLADLEPVRRRLAPGPTPRLPGARALARELLTFPTHGRVTDPDVLEITRALPRLPGSTSPRNS